MSEVVTSRRKQSKPSRLADTMNETTDATSLNSASVIVKASDLNKQSNDCNTRQLAGTILGPFQVRGPLADQEDNSTSEIGKGDVAGKLQLYSLDENATQQVFNIRIAKTAKSANCDLCSSKNGLFIRVNRTVEKFSELLANFCSSVELESVSSPKTTSSSTPEISPLCSLQDTLPDSAVPSTSYDIPFDVAPPHAIYLPVAFHNSSSLHMQILGYPQVIIPVAVGRGSLPLYTPSIYIDETLSDGLNLPRSIKISETQCSLALTKFANCINGLGQDCNRNKRKRSRLTENSIAALDSSLGDYAPLDLSLHFNKRQNDPHLEDKLSFSMENPTNEREKRFHCDCGVSFNNESTLLGHKKYYCRNSTNHNEVFREPQRKVPNRCQQCDFQPASASQLAQHVRSNHSTVQAYICQLCGYKGYSHRGIRSHLRTHNECTNCSDADLMAAYVFLMTIDSKKVQCQQCKKTLPTTVHLKQHSCE